MPRFGEIGGPKEIIDAFMADAPKPKITNDPKTWAVDWNEPVEWHDGTPIPEHGKPHHGQTWVEVDPLNLPAGVLQSAVTSQLRTHATKDHGATYATVINIIAAYGKPGHLGCTAKVVNTRHRIEQASMEDNPLWGSF